MSGTYSSFLHLLADDEEIGRYGELLDSLGIGLEVFAPDASVCHRNAIVKELCGDSEPVRNFVCEAYHVV